MPRSAAPSVPSLFAVAPSRVGLLCLCKHVVVCACQASLAGVQGPRGYLISLVYVCVLFASILWTNFNLYSSGMLAYSMLAVVSLHGFVVRRLLKCPFVSIFDIFDKFVVDLL